MRMQYHLRLVGVWRDNWGINMSAGSWPLATGLWLLVAGFWLLVTGCWLLASGGWLLAPGHWLLASGLTRQDKLAMCFMIGKPCIFLMLFNLYS